MYVPKQRDIVYVGKDSSNRRPALVVSKDTFNLRTGLGLVCPITDTMRSVPTYIPIQSAREVTGAIVTHQIHSLDYQKSNLTFVESCDFVTWVEVVETLEMFI